MERVIEYTGWAERDGYPNADIYGGMDELMVTPFDEYIPERMEEPGFKPFVRLTLTDEPRDVATFVGSNHARIAIECDVHVDGMGIANFGVQEVCHGKIGPVSSPDWFEDEPEIQAIAEVIARSQHRHHFEGAGMTLDYDGAVETQDTTLSFSRPVRTALEDGDGLVICFDDRETRDRDADVEVEERRNLLRVAADGTVDWVAPDPGEDERPYRDLFRAGDRLYANSPKREIDPETGEIERTFSAF